VKLIDLDQGDQLADMTLVPAEDEPEDAEEENGEGQGEKD
jgi:hypothetical protein